MKHWSYVTNTMVEDPLVDKFIEEVIALYDKYGLAISHEDTHGAFIITNLQSNSVYKDWLKEAAIINHK